MSLSNQRMSKSYASLDDLMTLDSIRVGLYFSPISDTLLVNAVMIDDLCPSGYLLTDFTGRTDELIEVPAVVPV